MVLIWLITEALCLLSNIVALVRSLPQPMGRESRGKLDCENMG